MAGGGRLFQRPIEKHRNDDLNVDSMSQIESETSGMTEGLLLFGLERLMDEERLAAVDLGKNTDCKRDRGNGHSSSTQASKDYNQCTSDPGCPRSPIFRRLSGGGESIVPVIYCTENVTDAGIVSSLLWVSRLRADHQAFINAWWSALSRETQSSKANPASVTL